MHAKYPNLFTPIALGKGGLVFKNRIWTAPTGTHLLSAGEPYPNEATVAHYREKARGGAACITFSCQNMDRLGLVGETHSDSDIFNARYHNYWARLTNAVHFFGARVSLELLAFSRQGYDECGERLFYTVNDEETEGGPSRMLSVREMERMADDYAVAAKYAIKVGFDMILLHFGHGTFVAQFLSPLANRRVDAFGGNAENRCRFPLMIIDGIREAVGPNVPIEVRLSGDELMDGGGGTEDCIDFLRRAEDRIDLAHISCGSMLDDITQTRMHPVEFYEAGCNAEFAEAVKKSGLRIPVLTIGAFQAPELMEEVLASGKADVVAMARGAIADADCANKALFGKEEEIIPCLKCFDCLAYDTATEFGCSANPRVGREYILPQFIPPKTESKKIVVIGGGPAGMAGAYYAAERGHEVILFEKAARLGGKIVFAANVPFKRDLAGYLRYQLGLLARSGVALRLGTEATPDMVRAELPDAVFAAVGSDPVIPAIPGSTSNHVMTAEECFGHLKEMGKRVAVIGGGQVGCETALYLATEGKKDVTVLEMRDMLAPDANFAPHLALNDRVPKHCAVLLGARCVAIGERSVTYIDAAGAERTAEADTVVFSAGMRSRTRLAESFRSCAPLFFGLGDCERIGNMHRCTRTAFAAAMQL